MPWWVTAILATVTLYYFRSYNEIILFGLVMDIYYSHLSPDFHLLDYRFTLFSLILLISSFYIKKRLKYYNE